MAAVDISLLVQRVGHGIDHGRINQRLVALDVDHRIAVHARGDFGDAVRAARDDPGEVISTRQNFWATSQIRVSSVATMTSLSDLAFWHCSTTCWMSGLPAISASGLPGKRVEA